MTNGRDRGPVGLPFRPDHAAEDTRQRKAACACLVVIVLVVIVVALLCGAGLAFAWM